MNVTVEKVDQLYGKEHVFLSESSSTTQSTQGKYAMRHLRTPLSEEENSTEGTDSQLVCEEIAVIESNQTSRTEHDNPQTHMSRLACDQYKHETMKAVGGTGDDWPGTCAKIGVLATGVRQRNESHTQASDGRKLEYLEAIHGHFGKVRSSRFTFPSTKLPNTGINEAKIMDTFDVMYTCGGMRSRNTSNTPNQPKHNKLAESDSTHHGGCESFWCWGTNPERRKQGLSTDFDRHVKLTHHESGRAITAIEDIHRPFDCAVQSPRISRTEDTDSLREFDQHYQEVDEEDQRHNNPQSTLQPMAEAIHSPTGESGQSSVFVKVLINIGVSCARSPKEDQTSGERMASPITATIKNIVEMSNPASPPIPNETMRDITTLRVSADPHDRKSRVTEKSKLISSVTISDQQKPMLFRRNRVSDEESQGKQVKGQHFSTDKKKKKSSGIDRQHISPSSDRIHTTAVEQPDCTCCECLNKAQNTKLTDGPNKTSLSLNHEQARTSMDKMSSSYLAFSPSGKTTSIPDSQLFSANKTFDEERHTERAKAQDSLIDKVKRKKSSDADRQHTSFSSNRIHTTHATISVGQPQNRKLTDGPSKCSLSLHHVQSRASIAVARVRSPPKATSAKPTSHPDPTPSVYPPLVVVESRYTQKTAPSRIGDPSSEKTMKAGPSSKRDSMVKSNVQRNYTGLSEQKTTSFSQPRYLQVVQNSERETEYLASTERLVPLGHIPTSATKGSAKSVAEIIEDYSPNLGTEIPANDTSELIDLRQVDPDEPKISERQRGVRNEMKVTREHPHAVIPKVNPSDLRAAPNMSSPDQVLPDVFVQVKVGEHELLNLSSSSKNANDRAEYRLQEKDEPLQTSAQLTIQDMRSTATEEPSTYRQIAQENREELRAARHACSLPLSAQLGADDSCLCCACDRSPSVRTSCLHTEEKPFSTVHTQSTSAKERKADTRNRIMKSESSLDLQPQSIGKLTSYSPTTIPMDKSMEIVWHPPQEQIRSDRPEFRTDELASTDVASEYSNVPTEEQITVQPKQFPLTVCVQATPQPYQAQQKGTITSRLSDKQKEAKSVLSTASLRQYRPKLQGPDADRRVTAMDSYKSKWCLGSTRCCDGSHKGKSAFIPAPCMYTGPSWPVCPRMPTPNISPMVLSTLAPPVLPQTTIGTMCSSMNKTPVWRRTIDLFRTNTVARTTWCDPANIPCRLARLSGPYTQKCFRCTSSRKDVATRRTCCRKCCPN